MTRPAAASARRPLELTLLSWVVLAIALVKGLGIAAVVGLPEVRKALGSLGIEDAENALLRVPLAVHYGVSVAGTAVLLASGAGLLRGRAWARLALALWSTAMLLFAYLTTGSLGYVAPKAASYAVMLAILFGPRASRYFADEPVGREPR